MYSSEVVSWHTPSSISTLPQVSFSKMTRCWCWVFTSCRTLDASSRTRQCGWNVSSIQRDMAHSPPGVAPWVGQGQATRVALGPRAPVSHCFRELGRPPRLGHPNGSLLGRGDLPRALVQGVCPQVFLDHDAFGLERPVQHVDGGMRVRMTAHKDIERGIAGLGPAVNADVTFRQHGHTRNATIGRKVVEVDMQQRCPRHGHAALQRLFDVLEIVKPPGAEQVNDKMGAGEAMPIAFDEVVFPVLVR